MTTSSSIRISWFIGLIALLWVSQAGAVITFRAAASASLPSAVGNTPALISRINNDAGASGASSLTINRPANVLSGHVLVAQLALKGSAATVGTVVAPAGWTLVNQRSSSGADPVTQAIYWKLAGATEPASYTWSWTNAVRVEGGIAAFSNVDPLAPIDSVGANATTSSTTITLPTITLNSNNVMLVAALVSSHTTSHTAPTGMNEQYDSNTGAGPNGVTASLATLAQVTTATSGVRTATTGQAVDNIAHLLALRAGGAALTINVPTGTTTGDVMIASVSMRPCSATDNAACSTTVTAPAGWTLVRQVQTRTGGGTDGYGSQLWVYQRVVTGVEPASYTWFFGGRPQQAGAGGGILTFSGVDTTSPIVADAAQATASARSHATPTIDTGAVVNTMLVATFAANSAAAWTPPAGMSERVDVASRATPNDLGLSLEMSTEARAAAGAVAAKTASYTGTQPTGDTGTTHLLALRPAAATSLDHIRIEHDGSAISCVAESLTVKACASSDCSVLHTGGVTGNVVAGGNTVSFTINSGASQTTVSMHLPTDGSLATDPQPVVVGSSGVTPSPVGTADCTNTTTPVTNTTTACNVSVSKAGFLFDVPNLTAGTASGSVSVRAVRSSDSTTCVPLFQSVTRTVAFWATYQNPGSGTLSLQLNGGSIETMQTAATPAYTSTAKPFA